MRALTTTIATILTMLLAISGCDKGADQSDPKADPAKQDAAKPKDAAAKSADDTKKEDPVAAKAKDLLDNTKAGEQLKGLKAQGDQLKASLEDKAPPLTVERYEELILALDKCELKERNVDPKCEQYMALRKAKQNKASLLKDFAGMHAKLGRKHLGHESATVRFYSAGLMGSGFADGVSKEDVLTIVAAGKKEKDPRVLTTMLRQIGSSHGKAPAAGKFIIAMTRNKSELVRKEALGNLATWGKKTKGVVPAFKKAITKDKSIEVRAYACEHAGELGNDVLLPVMLKLVKNKKTDKALYAGCFYGIVNLWTKYPFAPEKPSKKAYKATLKLLKSKPRTQDRPPWRLAGFLAGLKKPDEKWVAKAKFFKKNELIKAMSLVVTDKKANWMARKGFVTLMLEIDTPKATFEKLHKQCLKFEKDTDLVVKELAKAIEKAK